MKLEKSTLKRRENAYTNNQLFLPSKYVIPTSLPFCVGKMRAWIPSVWICLPLQQSPRSRPPGSCRTTCDFSFISQKPSQAICESREVEAALQPLLLFPATKQSWRHRHSLGEIPMSPLPPIHGVTHPFCCCKQSRSSTVLEPMAGSAVWWRGSS